MARYDKNSAERWLNEHHFGYYNSEEDKGTGAEEIPTINRVFEAWDDEAEWLTADPVDQDREHANLYGGDREYCDECGRRLTMGMWGSYCSHCNPDYEEGDYDEVLDRSASEWELIDRKNVEDSDGFITEYSWYQKGDEHVMVFGDSDLYRPEDGDYDAEFDSEERAREWFSSYEGFTDHNEGLDKDRFNCLEDECAEEKPLNEAKTYRGIPNTIYVYHGEWSDPEVYINGKGFSEWDVEDYIWGDYVESCEDNGEEPTDEGFAKYCEENGEDLCNSFYYSNLEFMSAKEIVKEVEEFANDSLGMIYMVTDDYVEVIFNYPGHTNGADNFIHDLEDSYLGKENLIKIEKTDNSTGDELDSDDYEPEVIVKVTATPNSLSEGIDEDALEELVEAFEEEDKPFTKSQIRDELRRETNNWTKASDEIYYGFESEYEYAMAVLKKHYKEVSGEEKGNRYYISFSEPTKKLKEGYTHFKFTSGSNPYIAKTEQERDRLLKKYGDKVTKKSDTEYVVDDKEEDKFAPGDLKENKEDALYDYKTRQATGSWDRDDDDYLLNQDDTDRYSMYYIYDKDGKKIDSYCTLDGYDDDEVLSIVVGDVRVAKVVREDYDENNILDNSTVLYPEEDLDESIKSPDAVNNALNKFRSEGDDYGCDKCGKRIPQDKTHWFNGASVGLCDGCYDKLSKDEEEKLDATGNLSESILTSDGYTTPSEGAVEQFLDKYGFGDDRYPKTVYTDNASKGKEIVASFTDGISAADFKVIEKHVSEFFGKCPVEVTLGKEHKDGEDLWATIVFDFSKCKLDEAKQLNEGPGAGYTLEGKIKVDGIETLKPVKFDVCNDFGYRNSYDVTFECVGVGKIEDFRFESYMYGDTVDEADIDISAIKVNLWKEGGFENIDEFVKSNLEYIKNCIVGARVESSYVYGGGYVHSKFDGTVCDIDELLNNSYSDEFDEVCTELFAIEATIRDTSLIEYVDKAVTGDTYYDRYEVMDSDREFIEDFEDESDAIKYAESHTEAVEVVKTSYHELFGGDLDIEDSETVWEREEEYDESFKAIPGGKAIMESLVKNTLENYPNASSKAIARKTFDKSFEKHNITFEKWHKLVESVNK